MSHPVETAEVGTLRVVVEYDDDSYASNPRDNDNLSVIYGKHRRYNIGDGLPPSDEDDAWERGGPRLLARYLRMCKGVIAIRGVGMYDHSGVSYYTFPLGGDSKAPFGQHRDWDSGMVGYAYVTRASWAAMQGDGTTVSVEDAERVIDGEVKEYGAWANGEVYGYRVIRPCPDAQHEDSDEAADCDHAETIDSCWGFIGDPQYALDEGKASAETFVRSEEDNAV